MGNPDQELHRPRTIEELLKNSDSPYKDFFPKVRVQIKICSAAENGGEPLRSAGEEGTPVKRTGTVEDQSHRRRA